MSSMRPVACLLSGRARWQRRGTTHMAAVLRRLIWRKGARLWAVLAHGRMGTISVPAGGANAQRVATAGLTSTASLSAPTAYPPSGAIPRDYLVRCVRAHCPARVEGMSIARVAMWHWRRCSACIGDS